MVGGVLLLMLPVSYVGLKLGMPVTFVACANAWTAILAIFARMYMLRGDFPSWSSRVYFEKVFLNVIGVSVIACIAPAIPYYGLPDGFLNFLITSFTAFVSCCLSIYFIGCSSVERHFIQEKSKELYVKLKMKF